MIFSSSGNGGRERRVCRAQNTELYCTRIKILGSCLFLQSVLANLHTSRLSFKTTVTLTAIVMITKMIMILNQSQNTGTEKIPTMTMKNMVQIHDEQ